MSATLLDHTDVVGTRNHGANALLAGGICRLCNNTWMDALDRSVESIVLNFARSPGARIELDGSSRFQLARWILKTACTFSATDRPSRRVVPSSILRNVHREDFLPEGFVAFGKRKPAAVCGIAAAVVDMWPTVVPHNFGPQENRFKFGIQYDCVNFGCAWLNYRNPMFTLLEHLHEVIIVSNAEVKVWNVPEFSPLHAQGMPDAYYKNDLYGWLGAVDGMGPDGVT